MALLFGCFVLSACAEEHPQVNVALLGDSNTFIGGEQCNQDRGWSKWFKDKFQPSTCKSYARSGATWTNSSSTQVNLKEYTEKLGNNNVIYNQVLRLIEATRKGEQPKPQLIILMAGTNDAWFKSSRPMIYAKSPQQVFSNHRWSTSQSVNKMTSLAESVRYSCEKLMESFPEAQIVLVTPMQIAKPNVTDIRKVGNIIEECGRYLSVPVIRLDFNGVVYSDRERIKPTFTSDGVHTNVEGARRNGYYIAHQVESVLQF